MWTAKNPNLPIHLLKLIRASAARYCISSVFKIEVFTFQNSPRSLDPTYKTDLDYGLEKQPLLYVGQVYLSFWGVGSILFILLFLMENPVSKQCRP